LEKKNGRSRAEKTVGRATPARARARATAASRARVDSNNLRRSYVRAGRAFAVRLFLKDARTRDAGSRARAAVSDFQSFNL